MADRQDPFAAFFDMQGEMMREMFGRFAPEAQQAGATGQWAEAAEQLRTMWLDFAEERLAKGPDPANPFDPAQWALLAQGWANAAPPPDPAAAQKLMTEGFQLWQGVAQAMLGPGPDGEGHAPELPRKDRRFADPAWQEHPAYLLLHQTYLMLADYVVHAARSVQGVPEEQRAQLEFATRTLLEAMSPDNFLATNPVVLRRTIETGGQNLVTGMRHLIDDLRRGQLTHTNSSAFALGENIATTPGKVVYETPLYQLIQYSPATEQVLAVPLVIFPPWINRFYILDLTPKKSFIKWAVDQGLSVFGRTARRQAPLAGPVGGQQVGAPVWMMREFIASVVSGTFTGPGLATGVAVSAVLLAIEESLRTGETVTPASLPAWLPA